MGFDILTIRTAEFDDGSMYPVLGDQTSLIELEALDGANVEKVFAKRLAVFEHREKVHTLGSFANISAEVFITEARVAVACVKFEKGGTLWGVGGLGYAAAALTYNTVSAVRAARRRKGKMLVGHVRYPWLQSVSFSRKTGMLSEEEVILMVHEKADGATRAVGLRITLPKQSSAEQVARAIVSRAAYYRLVHDTDFVDEEREKLEELLDPPTIGAEAGGFAIYHMPSFFPPVPETAYPGSAVAALVEPDLGGALPDPDPAPEALAPGPVASALAPAIGFCGGCGTAWRQGSRFCNRCGWSTDDLPAGNPVD